MNGTRRVILARYSNAKEVLPAHLLREVQKHVEGVLLYIPSADEHRRPWGSLTGLRQELKTRNEAIREEYRRGAGLEFLAEKYHLSYDTVRKIIRPRQG
ncbi:MAG TPA: hypothetical protein GXX29_12095 [Firmicutes bacterium]|nr:hypothetical protein [Bacillota bacterium]